MVSCFFISLTFLLERICFGPNQEGVWCYWGVRGLEIFVYLERLVVWRVLEVLGGIWDGSWVILRILGNWSIP